MCLKSVNQPCIPPPCARRSWGPLGWLIPSEAQPLETRSAGFSLTVSMNFLWSFVIVSQDVTSALIMLQCMPPAAAVASAPIPSLSHQVPDPRPRLRPLCSLSPSMQGQCFLSMLCSMQWGVFLFFAACVLAMTIFVSLLVPETKGVPMEEVYTLYAKHWYWKQYCGAAGEEVLELETARSASRQFSRAEDGASAGGRAGRGGWGGRWGSGAVGPGIVRAVGPAHPAGDAGLSRVQPFGMPAADPMPPRCPPRRRQGQPEERVLRHRGRRRGDGARHQRVQPPPPSVSAGLKMRCA